MSEKEKQEYEEEIRILKLIHQTYLEHESLGGTQEERVEHLLDIMERIAEIQELLKEANHDEGHTDALD